MIIRSAGFCHKKLIRSQNTLNFAYILYLKLREQGYKPELIEKYVRRWFVYSILRGRYSSSPESAFDFDVKQIAPGKDFGEYLANVEAAELSDTFWDFGVVQQLNTSVASSPTFNVFPAVPQGQQQGPVTVQPGCQLRLHTDRNQYPDWQEVPC